ncbi:hypothetical protein N7508_003479 [Penicillium antarcticum]|uniref:uncharacterized protein n=1 Tax=Penicillium antarcticum TaxID=416450 RepID=UPI002396A389|nr:uncharacterized protein N7508_003479 [Penicillium antarcticum]KAJ5312649.1 hypothetical protein N7508_003479 [Penicillium antarcticum]
MTTIFHGGHVETPKWPSDLQSREATPLVRADTSSSLGLHQCIAQPMPEISAVYHQKRLLTEILVGFIIG